VSRLRELFECIVRNRDNRFIRAVQQEQEKLACIRFISSIWILLAGGIQRSETRLGWIPIVISMAHRQSVGIVSGGLPIWLRSLGIHVVGELLHFLINKIVTTISLLHGWIFMRGIVGICPRR